MKAVGKSVTGRLRKNNEDAYYLSDEKSPFKDLFIIADGMGGHRAGEVASHNAIEAFLDYLKQNKDLLVSKDDLLDCLVGAMQESNEKVYEKSLEDKAFYGMGTTFTAAAVQQGKLFIAHVGDSRLYLYKDGELKQITKDHSYVMEMVKQGKITLEEAAVHPNKNVITRALGTKKNIEIDTFIEEFGPFDTLLMCSDGLSNMVTDEEIKEVLGMELSLEQKAEKLVETANERGGIDNISVIVAKREVL